METAPRQTTTAAWIGLLFLAAGLRALCSLGLLGDMPMVSDAASYRDEALGLLSVFPPDHAFYWPPGTSLTLALFSALFGPSLLATRLLLLGLGTAAVGLSALIARRLRPGAEGAALLLAALYMPAVLLSGQSYSQHQAALCLLLLAYLGLRAKDQGHPALFLLAGLAYGLGCLTRPSMVSLLPALGGAWLWRLGRVDRGLRRRFILGAVLFCTATVVLVVPVLRHNHARGAGFVLSTNNERNFFLGNNPYTPDYKTSHLGQRPLSELQPEVRGYLQGFYSRSDSRAAMRLEAQRYVLSHPLRTLFRCWNRTLSFWGFDYLAARIIQRHAGLSRAGLVLLLSVEAGAYLMVMALCIIGLLCHFQSLRRGVALWLLLLVLSYQLPYTLAFSGGTYHFPVMGLLIPISAAALWPRPGPAPSLPRGRWAWLALAALLLIQLQYAYHAIAMES